MEGLGQSGHRPIFSSVQFFGHDLGGGRPVKTTMSSFSTAQCPVFCPVRTYVLKKWTTPHLPIRQCGCPLVDASYRPVSRPGRNGQEEEEPPDGRIQHLFPALSCPSHSSIEA